MRATGPPDASRLVLFRHETVMRSNPLSSALPCLSAPPCVGVAAASQPGNAEESAETAVLDRVVVVDR